MQILGSEPIFAWLLKSFSYSINSQSVLLSGSPPEFLGGHQKENKHNNPKEGSSSKILVLSVFGGGYYALIGGLFYEKQSLE